MSAKEDGSLEEGEVDAALLSSSNKEGDEEQGDDSSSTTTSDSSSQEAPTRAKKQKRKQATYPELDPTNRMSEKFDFHEMHKDDRRKWNGTIRELCRHKGYLQARLNDLQDLYATRRRAEGRDCLFSSA